MTPPYYRSIETGNTQFHPVSGLGKVFNAEEIEEDGTRTKPRTSLAPTKTEIAEAKRLQKNNAKTPSQTTEAKTGNGDSSKQEGSQ